MQKAITALAVLFTSSLFAQQTKSPAPILPTSGADRWNSVSANKTMEQNSLLSNIEFSNIGPTIMGGRCVDLDVNPTNTNEFYAAYASGGLWHTTNNGQSFTPVFDHEAVMTIGDAAVNWNNSKQIWVGTGEANSSRSSYAGIGVYKSSDGGTTWQYKGLAETQHIGKVLISPLDSNTVFVAALGHLYTNNKERGVYKTTDGGTTWKQVLYVNDTTGAIDVQMDPNNPHTLYACMWQRDRKAWNFSECGAGSGIYKSTDDGNTWTLITGSRSGFPIGSGVGRIGLSIFAGNSSLLYASLDNQFHKPETPADTSMINAKDLTNMSADAFAKLNDDKLKNFLLNNGFPEKYDAATVKQMVADGKITPKTLVDYLNDANNSLFNTPVIGEEVYRSEDGGATWKKVSDEKLTDLVYTYGYYFGKIYVSSFNSNRLFVLGVPLLMSEDGGKTWRDIDGDNVHGDHHAVWLDKNLEGHMIIGNDGGINISYDFGKNWVKCNTPAVGQFYSVTTDDAQPYNVYGGLQDNGVWFGSSDYTASTGWQGEGKYPYTFIYGGDGMQVQVDTRDNSTVYAGYQFGYYARFNTQSDDYKDLHPQNDLGTPNYRFNWQSPILLSKHNQDVFYFGSNCFHRSLDKGQTWDLVSPDLTNHNHSGDVPYNTLTSIAESPMKFGLIYVGTDDGNVQLTKDGGYTWTKISAALPQNLWVSRVTPSAFVEGRVYVSLSGYRYDNFAPYLFVSDDFGTTWKNISANLPDEPINVVKEDPKNQNIIYVGTDNGLYASIDAGKTFMVFGNLPRVAVHDIAIQKTANEMVVGTHGRSLYKASLDVVQSLADSGTSKPIIAFSVADKKFSANWAMKLSSFDEPSSPTISIPYYAKQSGVVRIIISTPNKTVVATMHDTATAGINIFSYNLQLDSLIKADYITEMDKDHKLKMADDKNYYLLPGTYNVLLIDAADNMSTVSFNITKRKKESEPSPNPLSEPGENVVK